MIIKEADGRSDDVRALESLAARPDATADARKRIAEEIVRIKAGARAEADVAYELWFAFGASANWCVIHDLRIEREGRVAQTDHVVMNRFLDVHVIETKSVYDGFGINEAGEFTAWYHGKARGVASPLEQVAKHGQVLRGLMEDGPIPMPVRLGMRMKPTMHLHVAVSKTARITRPKKAFPGLDRIVKLDQLASGIRGTEPAGVLATLGTAAKMVGPDALEATAKAVAARHRPIRFDWAARFGMAEGAPGTEPPGGPAPPAAARGDAPPKAASGRRCAACDAEVDTGVAAFCRFNARRFDGKTYCRECQGARPA